MLTSTEIRAALEEPVSQIVARGQGHARPHAARARRRHHGPGDHARRRRRAAARAWTQRMREECQMPCQLTESPLTCVAVGSGRSLEEFEVIHRMNRHYRPAPASGRRRLADVPQAGTPAPGGAGRADRPVAGPALDQLQRGRQRAAALDPARRLDGVRRRLAEVARARPEAGPRPRQLVRRDLRRPRRERGARGRGRRSCARRSPTPRRPSGENEQFRKLLELGERERRRSAATSR